MMCFNMQVSCLTCSFIPWLTMEALQCCTMYHFGCSSYQSEKKCLEKKEPPQQQEAAVPSLTSNTSIAAAAQASLKLRPLASSLTPNQCDSLKLKSYRNQKNTQQNNNSASALFNLAFKSHSQQQPVTAYRVRTPSTPSTINKSCRPATPETESNQHLFTLSNSCSPNSNNNRFNFSPVSVHYFASQAPSYNSVTVSESVAVNLNNNNITTMDSLTADQMIDPSLEPTPRNRCNTWPLRPVEPPSTHDSESNHASDAVIKEEEPEDFNGLDDDSHSQNLSGGQDHLGISNQLGINSCSELGSQGDLNAKKQSARKNAWGELSYNIILLFEHAVIGWMISKLICFT